MPENGQDSALEMQSLAAATSATAQPADASLRTSVPRIAVPHGATAMFTSSIPRTSRMHQTGPTLRELPLLRT
jgi:hypothetical protein